MKVTHPTIKILLKYYKEISLLGKIKGLLDWDLNVNLPPMAGPERAAQIGYLTEKITNIWYLPKLRNALEKAQTIQDELSVEEKAIVRNFLDGAKFYHKVPKELIIKQGEVTAEAFPVWKKAKEENDYKTFFPYLKEIITINQDIASHLGYNEHPYDALLDLYEPKLTVSFCEALFGELKPALVGLLQQIQTSKHYEQFRLLKNVSYPIAEQERLSHFLARRMGFDFDAGRLDESPHPFTAPLNRHDVRITTRYKVNDMIEPLSSTMHEAGHALYAQGIEKAYTDTPLEYHASMGIDESLSRFWENIIGKHPAFLRFLTPLLQNSYYDQLGSIDEEQVVRLFNQVAPGLIRIEADEVTYSLHILLRFEIEKELIGGKITPEDAAEAWNEKSQQLLGMKPKTASEGILQDVHWTYGAFGYFPSYTLGNLYGAQFLSILQQEIAVEKELSEGNLFPFKAWLDLNIHRHGSLYLPEELIKKVTGKPLDAQYFIDYLTEKYMKIYEL